MLQEGGTKLRLAKLLYTAAVVCGLLLPLGALFSVLCVGWVWSPEKSVEEATSHGRFKFSLAPVYKFMVKIVDPIAIGVIIIAGLVFGMSIS